MTQDDFIEQVERFINGDESFADEVVKRYFHRLTKLARLKLTSLPPQVADSEAAALSALRSLFSGIKKAQFKDLKDHNALWRLLATITVRKAIAQLRRHWKPSGEGGRRQANYELNQVIGNEPSSETVVALIEEVEKRIQSLEDETTQKVAWLTLAGYGTGEISEELQVTRRTVQRKRNIIREQWRPAELDNHDL